MLTQDISSHDKLDLSQLSGDQFQKIIFERIIDKIFIDHRVLTVEDHAQGAVDYVVREQGGTGIIDTNRFHYFECKNYGRTLELDNVAKIMVVAVSDQPTSVHVVSRTSLQPQIKKYASRIFNVDCEGNPIFKSIVFRHWLANDVGDFSKTDFDGNSHSGAKERHDIVWWISECAAFSEMEISSSEIPCRQVSVRRGVLLVATLELLATQPKETDLIGLPGGSWESVASGEVGGTGRRLSYLIKTEHLDTGVTYQVSVRLTGGSVDTRVPLGQFLVGEDESYLPELRPVEVVHLEGHIGPQGAYRLVLIDGEAGAGKTHLIEKVAETLRAKSGFDVMRFTVTEETHDSLMENLLRGCLTPPMSRGTFQELAEAVQRALLTEAGERTLETDISLLARVATRMGPRVIVLRDCQHITTKLANQLWALIIALDDASWGGVRLILEFRQPEAEMNSALRWLVENIRCKIRRVVLEKRLLPLDKTQFSSAMNLLFTDVTDELTACLRKRTGALPLFIESYLRRLHGKGLIVRSSGAALFSISHPAQVLADSLPVSGQIILEDRVRSWVQEKFGATANQWVIRMGLIALAEDAQDQALVSKALGLSQNDVRVAQTALDQGGLGYGRPDGQIVFHHDLLRVAIISVALSYANFGDRAMEVSRTLLSHVDEVGEVPIRSIRCRIFSLLGDNVALETELRAAIEATQATSDFGRQGGFLVQLLELLKDRSDSGERLDLMTKLAWAAWVSDSLLVARNRYMQLADEAERCTSEDFSIAEAVATDAYRRAIGIDLELVEPLEFLTNTIKVLRRRQTHMTYNSIMNRLVLFCARFGLPKYGHELAALAFNYVGDGRQNNEGAVLYSELGALYAASEPKTALNLFRQGVMLAQDECQSSYNSLDIAALECLHLGSDLNLDGFGRLWKSCSRNQFSESLTRASLLRGSLELRNGDVKSAGHWISRTATLIRLYHLKEFHLAVMNDQVLLALLQANEDAAKASFVNMVHEYERVWNQLNEAMQLLEPTMGACRKAAATLAAPPTSLEYPCAAPGYCSPYGELAANISAFASALNLPDPTDRYRASTWVVLPSAIPPHRHVKISGHELILGAY